ncbi:helix-turn-helix domain-containing protein [Micromonospora sp. C28SCA-DRY-2]|uniref:TetR/AcrR family transcriptional regulator n=1 Tax=Micromonospora sp. C28SCA-DRY-2 TaxID=3059522 RepID=UPI00267750FB|nr:TetR/AcrR family transcriptional regulator [Micromonospora sp. C28SCA-DRY-2]MDO3704845.1 helix-turn-helix domain-containing protein [Micromonospora sp. C28SCA-DRY-2]
MTPDATRRDRADRPLTLTEQARRAQLIRVTTDLVARHGYAGTSLARIAEAAGLSKAAVLYHFPSKDAVVRAAYAAAIEALVAEVGAAVEAASGADALAAYVRSLVAHLRAHPEHARMIVEAIAEETGVTDRPDAPSRRQSVAALVEAARSTGDYRPDVDPDLAAVLVNGAVDAIVAEQLARPDFDSGRAADELVELLDRSYRRR